MAAVLPDFYNWSTDDLTYTVSYSKISCWRPMYFAHVFWCYVIALSGIFCMVSRVHPVLHKFHAWSGRIYIISMLWATATSLLIHNTGLPAAVLVSFIICLGGMCLAWILILIHRDQLNQKALARASLTLSKHFDPGSVDLALLVESEKKGIVAELTVWQRVFSLKALHGAIMFTSWINIFGRIMASDQSGSFTCHTQPYYKPGYQEYTEFTMVPAADSGFDRLPWAKTGLLGWGLALSVGPLAASYVLGAIWAGVGVCCARKKTLKDSRVTADAPSEGKQQASVSDLHVKEEQPQP